MQQQNTEDSPLIPTGILFESSTLGASSFSPSCLCPEEQRMWQYQDSFGTIRCLRCSSIWHRCRIHGTEVSGSAPFHEQCSCNKPYLQPSKCPHCNSSENPIEPSDLTSTLMCRYCRQLFHLCPTHGTSIKGSGYHKSALDMMRCQCHTNPKFLNDSWASPFH